MGPTISSFVSFSRAGEVVKEKERERKSVKICRKFLVKFVLFLVSLKAIVGCVK
jgi:hypothetical protein